MVPTDELARPTPPETESFIAEGHSSTELGTRVYDRYYLQEERAETGVESVIRTGWQVGI